MQKIKIKTIEDISAIVSPTFSFSPGHLSRGHIGVISKQIMLRDISIEESK